MLEEKDLPIEEEKVCPECGLPFEVEESVEGDEIDATDLDEDDSDDEETEDEEMEDEEAAKEEE